MLTDAPQTAAFHQPAYFTLLSLCGLFLPGQINIFPPHFLHARQSWKAFFLTKKTEYISDLSDRREISGYTVAGCESLADSKLASFPLSGHTQAEEQLISLWKRCTLSFHKIHEQVAQLVSQDKQQRLTLRNKPFPYLGKTRVQKRLHWLWQRLHA